LIAIVDYGMGNLRSVRNALDRVGAESALVDDPASLRAADRVVLPGVGAFPDAIAALRERGLADALRTFAAEGRPLLGICLGMQLLASRSSEFGDHDGLGLIPGSVELLAPGDGLRVPHVGWNDLEVRPAGADMFATAGDEPTFYFVHSYEFRPSAPEAIAGVTDYGGPVTAAVADGRVWGVQFHPEKSAEDGLALLARFAAC
jgi:glutamine amidotransferase